MNAIARAITHGIGIGVRPTTIVFSKVGQKILWLAVLLMFTALSVIYLQDLHRRLFISYQDLQQVNNNLNVKYSQLLLEESTWANQGRIQAIAENQLNMQIPSQDEIVMLKF